MTQALWSSLTFQRPMVGFQGAFLLECGMISLQQCTSIAGLSSNEVILGVTPSARHEALLQSYVSIRCLSRVALRGLIVRDLRNFLDLGATRQAGDRFIVLRQFLSENSDARPSASEVEKAAAIRADAIRGWRPKSPVARDRRPPEIGAAA
jgi:hypothetical protein